MFLVAMAVSAAVHLQDPPLGWDDAVLCSVALKIAGGAETGQRAADLARLADEYGRQARRLGAEQGKDTAMQLAIYEGAFTSPEYRDQGKAAAQACETRGRELFPAS